MKQCNRCNRWFRASPSALCEECWVELGQLSFEGDRDLHFWNDDDPDEDGYGPQIASQFDRAEDRF